MNSINEIELYNKSLFYITRSLWEDLSDYTYVVVKGVPLSQLCYGNMCNKKSVDIDILVPRDSVKTIEFILKKHGFLPFKTSPNRANRVFHMMYSHQTTPHYKLLGDTAIVIDINHSIFWGEYEGHNISIRDFCSDYQTMNIAGTTIKVLSPMKAFVHLVLHGYKDNNSIYLLSKRNMIDRNSFKDIYYFLINNAKTTDLNLLYSYCVTNEIESYVFYMLFYTNVLYKDKLLSECVERFKSEKGLNLLNSFGLCSKERKQWDVDFITRLEAKDLGSLMKSHLTINDLRKIEINKKFLETST